MPTVVERKTGLRLSRVVRAVASLAFFAVISAPLLEGCDGAKYPTCDNDEQCNTEGHKGVCVDKKCVLCRDDKGCGTGQQCQMGACSPIPNYCDDTHACPQDSTCGPDHQCQAAKAAQPQAFVECDEVKGCGKGSRCENGHCTAPKNGGPGCTDFPSPKFDYESQDLSGEGRQTLERLARCITSGSLKGAQILLTGHCDARGEEEFNMSLGDNRAQGVKTFLVGLGISTNDIRTSSRGKLDATGTDEAGWATDRRVDIEVR